MLKLIDVKTLKIFVSEAARHKGLPLYDVIVAEARQRGMADKVALAPSLVLDFARLGLRSVDNLEGMTWGPPLTNGERVLLLVSDNNFNPAEVTQFIALAETPACSR